MAELTWHIEAAQDLNNIGEFIRRDSPANAALFVSRIIDAGERLRDQPRIGRTVPELADERYRELIFQNYRIVYRLLGESLTIIGVVHASLNFERIGRERGWDIT